MQIKLSRVTTQTKESTEVDHPVVAGYVDGKALKWHRTIAVLVSERKVPVPSDFYTNAVRWDGVAPPKGYNGPVAHLPMSQRQRARWKGSKLVAFRQSFGTNVSPNDWWTWTKLQGRKQEVWCSFYGGGVTVVYDAGSQY